MSSAAEVFETVEVLKDFIVFQFEDEVDKNNRNAFHEKTESGIILRSNFDKGTKEARWGIVVAVGPEVVTDIKVGTRVLIAPMMWTKISTFREHKFSRTQEKHVLAVE